MKREAFGTTSNGQKVEIVTLKNDIAELRILNRGATIQSFTVYGKSVIGGYDTFEGYKNDRGSYQGATVGRVANRVANAQFTMDGAIYMLPANNNGHCLHGGQGYSFSMFDFTEVSENSVSLSYFSPDGEEGFPSGLEVKVKFSLIGGAIKIDYEAIPDGKTPIALTNHSYFNLDGMGGLITDHIATIYADNYTEVDETLIPTGVRPDVSGTAYDFRSPKRIGEDFGTKVDGYDHNYILCPKISKDFEDKTLPLGASVTNGKLTLNVYTDQPGLQFYTGNFLAGGPDFDGGIPKVKHGAFCLEAQTEPNCINHGIGFYDAGEKYTQTTVYEVIKN